MTTRKLAPISLPSEAREALVEILVLTISDLEIGRRQLETGYDSAALDVFERSLRRVTNVYEVLSGQAVKKGGQHGIGF